MLAGSIRFMDLLFGVLFGLGDGLEQFGIGVPDRGCLGTDWLFVNLVGRGVSFKLGLWSGVAESESEIIPIGRSSICCWVLTAG